MALSIQLSLEGLLEFRVITNISVQDASGQALDLSKLSVPDLQREDLEFVISTRDGNLSLKSKDPDLNQDPSANQVAQRAIKARAIYHLEDFLEKRDAHFQN